LDVTGKATTVIDGGGKVHVGCPGYSGRILVKNNAGAETIQIDGQGLFRVGGKVDVGGGGQWGIISSLDVTGKATTVIDGGGKVHVGCPGYWGHILVKNNAGAETIQIRGDWGDITLLGGDCAEEFDVSERDQIEPGTVLSIGEDGLLKPSQKPFDKRVAGVVSGGMNYHPGLILDKKPSKKKRLPVALTGKTYCKVDAQESRVEIGDLLTTSSIKGHAMKANDPLKAFGAVIGKALAPLSEGTGLIPILVALQ